MAVAALSTQVEAEMVDTEVAAAKVVEMQEATEEVEV